MRRYLPPGVARPDHLPLSLGGVPVEAGPDGCARPGMHGIIIGGRYTRGEQGWTPCDGYWIHPGGGPAGSLRIDARDGVPVEVEPGRSWLIPAYLKRAVGGGYVSALPRVLGMHGWVEQAHLRPLLERLRSVCRRVFDGLDDGLSQDEREADLIEVVCMILAEQYHITRAELIALGWLTDHEAGAIIAAAIAPAMPQDGG